MSRPAVLAIDPGRAKCGVAVVDSDRNVLHRAVVLTGDLSSLLTELCSRFQPEALLVGRGTGAAPILKEVEALSPACPVEIVEEAHTSEAARARYVAEIPARGLRRLLPRSLRTPETAYDDFVAVILAERWWEEKERASG